mmetsp:Transcript_41304/g.110447  ORF Transcript_41304/g.110447 Transcript_41304/m.110447 type:complete len:361 (+) Transcript_41304:1208-2290(+)
MLFVITYVYWRNICPLFRQYHMGCFVLMGKITLESYLAQFHFLLVQDSHGGYCKNILELFPGAPSTNAVIVGLLFVWMSRSMLEITNGLRVALIPEEPKDRFATFFHRLVLLGAGISVALVFAGFTRAWSWGPGPLVFLTVAVASSLCVLFSRDLGYLCDNIMARRPASFAGLSEANGTSFAAEGAREGSDDRFGGAEGTCVNLRRRQLERFWALVTFGAVLAAFFAILTTNVAYSRALEGGRRITHLSGDRKINASDHPRLRKSTDVELQKLLPSNSNGVKGSLSAHPAAASAGGKKLAFVGCDWMQGLMVLVFVGIILATQDCFIVAKPLLLFAGGARMDLFAAYERMGQKLENQPPG